MKKIDIRKDLYNCCPLLNKECTKENCYINNGPCRLTSDYNQSQEYLAEYKNVGDRYLTLKRYLRILIKENRVDIQNVESILYALDPPLPIPFENEEEE